MSNATMEAEPSICEPGGRGMIFPLDQAEQEWNNGLRVILYLMATLYLFYGVNTAADKFMVGIEAITSSKKMIETKDGKVVTVLVWNKTVATLTLLALGSSSPEILLSIVEIVGDGFHAGALGPGTIVGSAAYNMFIIVAICIYAIDSSEIRKVKEIGVYVVTGVCSMFAYFWLLFIVQISSPDVVQVWEAASTLLMFPVFLAVSYLVDIGYWKIIKEPPPEASLEPPLPPPALPPPDHGTMPLQTVAEAAGAGVIGFPKETWEAHVGYQEVVETIPVYRTGGARGAVSCKYRMEGRTAVPGHDFLPSDGELTFAEGATRSEIRVSLMPKRLGEHSDRFQIILEDCEGGARFDPSTDGGARRSVLTVTIMNANDRLVRQSAVLRVSRGCDGIFNLDSCRAGAKAWREQIHEAVFKVGDDDDEEDQDGTIGSEDREPQGPSASDWFFYVVGLPWRFVFSIMIPPPEFMAGWLCFLCSLGAIGTTTAFILDFAGLFGCCAGIHDQITAITLVAVGTSLPDTFGSVTAALQDEYADASIVNVTGSNSVNVFLGIGLPWTMAALYWAIVDDSKWNASFADSGYPVGSFIVQGGDLGFSVLVFSVAAVAFFALVKIRRDKLGGELGGPYGLKIASSASLFLLWLFYVTLSIWKVLAGDVSVGTQVGAVGVGVVVLENLMLVVGAVLYFGGYLKDKKDAEFHDVEAQVVARKLGQEPLPHLLGPRMPTASWQETPQWASHMSGLRGSGALHAVTCQPRVLGAHPSAANKTGFSSTAMVLLAAARLKLRAGVGGDRRLWAHRRIAFEQNSGLRRSNSFHSCRGEGYLPSGSFQSVDEGRGGAALWRLARDPGDRSTMGRIGDRVGNFLGHSATDWVALSFAGLAARQLAAP